jgi:hypothetical protein
MLKRWRKRPWSNGEQVWSTFPGTGSACGPLSLCAWPADRLPKRSRLAASYWHPLSNASPMSWCPWCKRPSQRGKTRNYSSPRRSWASRSSWQNGSGTPETGLDTHRPSLTNRYGWASSELPLITTEAVMGLGVVKTSQAGHHRMTVMGRLKTSELQGKSAHNDGYFHCRSCNASRWIKRADHNVRTY